jgi:hypothetical protein
MKIFFAATTALVAWWMFTSYEIRLTIKDGDVQSVTAPTMVMEPLVIKVRIKEPAPKRQLRTSKLVKEPTKEQLVALGICGD